MKRYQFFAVLLIFFFSLQSPVIAAFTDTVDVNHATAQQLATLTGVGQVRAEAIVAYRKDHPPFRQAEDLLKVRGIGRVVVEQNRQRLRFRLPKKSTTVEALVEGNR